MKNFMSQLVICALFTLLSGAAFASESISGLNAEKAQAAVQVVAHRFIAKTAPDFGGSVKSPCAASLVGDQYTVTCSGTAQATIGGDGSVPIAFKCVGVFNQGQDGLFFKASNFRCK